MFNYKIHVQHVFMFRGVFWQFKIPFLGKFEANQLNLDSYPDKQQNKRSYIYILIYSKNDSNCRKQTSFVPQIDLYSYIQKSSFHVSRLLKGKILLLTTSYSSKHNRKSGNGKIPKSHKYYLNLKCQVRKPTRSVKSHRDTKYNSVQKLTSVFEDTNFLLQFHVSGMSALFIIRIR